MRSKVMATFGLVALLAGYTALTPSETRIPTDQEINASMIASGEMSTISGPVYDTEWLVPSLRSWLAPRVVEAQTGDFRGFQKTFTAQTAVGATASSGLMRGVPVAHTAELIVTGTPTTCTYRLQGSRDGVTWFNISAADITCTATTVAFENGKPAVTVRGNLLTLTGGTSPTITLKYIGK